LAKFYLSQVQWTLRPTELHTCAVSPKVNHFLYLKQKKEVLMESQLNKSSQWPTKEVKRNTAQRVLEILRQYLVKIYKQTRQL
jgi:hypothetical protein